MIKLQQDERSCQLINKEIHKAFMAPSLISVDDKKSKKLYVHVQCKAPFTLIHFHLDLIFTPKTGTIFPLLSHCSVFR